MEAQFGLGRPHRAPIKGILLCAAQPSEGEAPFSSNGLAFLRRQGAMTHGAVIHAFVGEGHLEADCFGAVPCQALEHNSILGRVVGPVVGGPSSEEGPVAGCSPGASKLDVPGGIPCNWASVAPRRGWSWRRSWRWVEGAPCPRCWGRSWRRSWGWHGPRSEEALWEIHQGTDAASNELIRDGFMWRGLTSGLWIGGSGHWSVDEVGMTGIHVSEDADNCLQAHFVFVSEVVS